MLLKSASELTIYLSSEKDSVVKEEVDIKTPLTMLKYSLSLAGEVNQTEPVL